MTCDGFRDQVFDYLGGTLRDRAAFQDHYASCPACASTLRGIEENEKLLSTAGAPAAPPELWPAIARAISAARPLPSRVRAWASLAAAAAVLLVVLSLLFSARPGLDVVIEERQADAETLRTFVPAYDEFDASPRGHP